MLAAKQADCLELDELCWFVDRKPRTETRENVHVMAWLMTNPHEESERWLTIGSRPPDIIPMAGSATSM